ncbi:hypothetical protein ANO11243_092490 [Dothideomycetidae sp. 11243]|nr:hypothetical protein ANO11243_092490 [fungal sp. No.11243]
MSAHATHRRKTGYTLATSEDSHGGKHRRSRDQGGSGGRSRLPTAWRIFSILELLVLILVLTARHRDANDEVTGPNARPSLLDPTKVALMIDSRPSHLHVPLLLHFVSVVPSEWTFLFLGSEATVDSVKRTPAVKRLVDTGKIEARLLPANVTITNAKQLSKFLTMPWTYRHVLHPAEHILVYQTDSILCANSARSVNEFLSWSWVGAPFTFMKYGGNGGLSLRRVSSIMSLLSQKSYDPRDRRPEDVWLAAEMRNIGIDDICPRDIAKGWGSSSMYSHHPMSYHTGKNGKLLSEAQFGTVALREELYEWCPEIKMHLDMDVASAFTRTCEPKWAKMQPIRDE